jgi:hypothetical protein
VKRLPLITSIVIIIGAVATIVLNVLSCRSRNAVQTPPEPAKPLTAAERTQAYARERMADPAYTNGLALLADRQAQLARLGNEAAAEFAAWSTNFYASNAVARALAESLEKLAGEGVSRTNAVFAAKLEELESMIAADPQGGYLLDKRAKIAEALAEHGRVASAFIAERLRRQRVEHAGEEAEAAKRYRDKLIAEGKITPPAPRPAQTNMPPPRKDGWWTNQPPAAAAGSSVPGSRFPVPGSGGPGAVPAASSSSGGPGAVPAAADGNLKHETRSPEPEKNTPCPFRPHLWYNLRATTSN